MELNIGEIIVDEELEIGNIQLDVVKEFPELEDIEITPSTTDMVYKSENYYGYNEVTVKGIEGVAEDLTTELTEQDNLIKEQEVTIEDIANLLDEKVANVFPTVEENTLILSRGNVEGGVLSI